MIDCTPLLPCTSLVLLLSRIMLAVVMLYFGIPKIKNLKSNAADFVSMGIKPGIFWGTIIALLEVVGGIAILFGFYAWVFAILFGFEMIGGTIHKITNTDKKFPDWSYDLLLLLLTLIILTFGVGKYSLRYVFATSCGI